MSGLHRYSSFYMYHELTAIDLSTLSLRQIITFQKISSSLCEDDAFCYWVNKNVYVLSCNHWSIEIDGSLSLLQHQIYLEE